MLAFFIGLGLFTSWLDDALGVDSPSNIDFEAYSQEVADAQEDGSYWKAIKSIGKMFFWTFGELPSWLDIILVIPRIVLVFVVARNIWIGGGG